MPDEWSDRRDALPQGSVLRDYTIEEVLGHGGFGIVYRARHNELDHVVAIKEYLPSELAVRDGTTVRAKSAECEIHFADGLRRFREEAKALIEFQQHPSIVDCREFFRANGTAYLVMEHVEGLTLSELLRQREEAGQPFTESDLLAIALPLARGLAHIHRAGVIHRDIKPANILVRKSDQQPVLIDFGAAKQAVAEHSRSLAPYTEGYAALEQVADGQLGPWTDLYGFGAVLWRIVAGGNRPWDPPNPVKVERRANARVREGDDPLPTAKELGAGRFAAHVLETIDGCLQLRDTERIRESDRVAQLLQVGGPEYPQSEAAKPKAPDDTYTSQPKPMAAEPPPDRSSGGRLRKVVGLAAAITVAMALVAVALIPRNETATPERWSFSIEAEPSTATIALLNGPEEYRPGMLLAPGQYEVTVSAPGYAVVRERVDHSESETLHRVELEPLPDAEQIPVDVLSTSEPVADDPVAARQGSVNSDGELSTSCGGGNWADCFELGKSYRDGDGVTRDSARAVEFLGRACNGGHAEACNHLGVSYAEGDGVKVDPAQAAELFERACEGGYARGCANLGASYLFGEGVGEDLSRAAELYRRACDAGSAEGCGALGLMYSTGLGVSQDQSLGVEFFQRGCEGGAAFACDGLGDMYSEGEGVAQDHQRAAELYERACEGGEPEGCNELGSSYFDGEGVGRDRARATELFEKACDAGFGEGCYNLGSSYYSGEGVERDRPRAGRLYGLACDAGVAYACYSLGSMYSEGVGVGQDHVRAAELYEQACDDGEVMGCFQLGGSYKNGSGVPLDKGRAAELYEQACESGLGLGCVTLGFMYDEGDGVGQDHVRMAELYQKGCSYGEASGCLILGASYENGSNVPLDHARAAELYRQACDGGNARGCVSLGSLYSTGNGVRQDHARAAELYERACHDGDAPGCSVLGFSFETGLGVPRDRYRATEYYRQACDGDDMGGCTGLARSYYHGHGIGQDRSVAKTLFQKACANGDEIACEQLQTLDWR